MRVGGISKIPYKWVKQKRQEEKQILKRAGSKLGQGLGALYVVHASCFSSL